ncbi:hypothetical protein GLU01_01355 [Nanohaloarchaea archaeon]|nr:hypothetical protein [Candidatus Nanohaloarchaea archaeon]
MSRLSVLLAGIVFLGSFSAAQPVAVSETSPQDGFERSLVGGENIEFSADVENQLDRGTPVGSRVVVESDLNMSDTGAEFSTSGVLSSETEASLETSYRRLSSSKGVYTLTGTELEAGEQADLNVDITASPRIEPGQYSFEISVLSIPGSPSDTENIEEVEANDSASASVESSTNEASVDVTPNENSSVNVTGYDDLSVDPPSEESEFVGGVEVELENDTEAEGEVSVEYDQSFVDNNGIDENSMSIYFFNETSGAWEEEEDSDVDTSDNIVTSNVDHFSLYSAFGDQEDSESDGSDDDGGGGGSIDLSDDDTQEQEEQSTEEDGTQDDEQDETGGEDSQEDSPQTDDGESTGSSDGTQSGQEGDTGGETDEQTGTGQTPTGSFTSSPGGLAGIAVLVLIAVIAVLERRGLINLSDRLLSRMGR